MKFLGLGKTLFNSSVCIFDTEGGQNAFEVVLSERILRKKYSGVWPERVIQKLIDNASNKNFDHISENSDVIHPAKKEEAFNRTFPFYENLSKKNLEQYSSHFNTDIVYNSHHLTHAYTAIASTPFEKCLILVVDGGGSRFEDLEEEQILKKASFDSNEFLSLYVFDNGKLALKDKKFQEFQKSKIENRNFSNGIGAFYETISEFIFNDKLSSGKVMGLAPFGEGEVVEENKFRNFLESLDWNKAFNGNSKEDWVTSQDMSLYQNLASTAQLTFENFLLNYLKEIQNKFPEYQNIIFTGGCALNCTFNWSLYSSKLFKNVHIPFSPNDSGISLGLSYKSALDNKEIDWEVTTSQNPYLGLKSSAPNDKLIKGVFSDFNVTHSENIEEVAANILIEGNVIAWFQGRSEVGPRALGNRSILAAINTPNLKNYLNHNIKFREEFRPYGCSVLQEDVHELFNCSESFENPFMSFAVPINTKYSELLKEITHIDETNRLQTVTKDLNAKYYSLLKKVKENSQFGILLNTSLNIMGEPIVEDINDVLNFFKNSKVKYLIVGDYLIEK